MLYTRCPDCQTVFRLSEAQLQLRGGLVRCGECLAIFHADRYLTDKIPAPATEQQAADTLPATPPDTSDAISTESGDTAPPAPSAPLPEIPTVTELLGVKPRSRTRPLFWATGILLLLGGLLAQIVLFYGNTLAQRVELRPWVVRACGILRCEIKPLQDLKLIELFDASVAPHPDYNGALRVRASILNRAPFTQPFPLLEISLTDSAGRVVARRTFTAEQYLEEPGLAPTGMPPNLALKTLQNVTSPGKSVTGYELRLVLP